MQTANILLGIGGNRGETVPKYNVTPAELAVLRVIHGDEAVYDIDINETEVQRTDRQEIGRLTETYSQQQGERRIAPAVNALFPGIGASVPKSFDDLELPEELFITESRKLSNKAEASAAKDGEKELKDMNTNELRAHADKIGVDLTGVTRKADILEAIELHEKAAAEQASQNGAGVFE